MADEFECIEFEDEDLVTIGTEFEKQMLQTNTELDMQRRHGEACLRVVDIVLKEILQEMLETEEDSE